LRESDGTRKERQNKERGGDPKLPVNGVYPDGTEDPVSGGHLIFSRPDLGRTTDRIFRKASGARWEERRNRRFAGGPDYWERRKTRKKFTSNISRTFLSER
jgi:hypothetical protein